MSASPSAQPRPVLLAAAADGNPLPILDVSHPRFASELDAETLAARIGPYMEEETRRQRMPRWLMALFLRVAGRQSHLIGAMAGARRGYLPALTTYLLKLGPDNAVPPLDNDIDRKILATLPARSMRLRLGQVATLLAEALAPQLAARPGIPMQFINIAGGAAMDSLNALILINRSDRTSLAGRKIVINVLDIDATGPHFGRNALEVLTGDGAPLAGLDAEFRHIEWDWRDLNKLREVLGEIGAPEAIIAASSEGGLFEYGGDGDIVGCLETLSQGTGNAAIVAGSVTRNDAVTRLFRRGSMFPIVPRGAEALAALAAKAGWRLAETRPAAFSDQVLLRKS